MSKKRFGKGTRSTRIAELQRFSNEHPDLWSHPFYQRKILLSFAKKWGLTIRKVVEYLDFLEVPSTNAGGGSQ